jgi:hypothetical protein
MMKNHNSVKNFSKYFFRSGVGFCKKGLSLTAVLFFVFGLIGQSTSAETAPQGNPVHSTPSDTASVSSGTSTVDPAARAAAETATRSWANMFIVATGSPRLSGFEPLTHRFTLERFPHHTRPPSGFTPASNACDRVNASQVLSRLSYMGNRFPSTTMATCILAYTDFEASEQGGRYVNPANPEYSGAITPPPNEFGGATQAYNPAGYYIRIQNLSVNSKQNLCRNPDLSAFELPPNVTVAQLSNYLSPRPQIYINGNAGGGADVVCTCVVGRTLDDPDGTVQNCTGPEFQNAVGRAIADIRAAQERVRTLTAAATPPTTVTPASSPNPNPSPAPTPAANEVAQCIEQAWAQSESCKRLSDSAKRACTRAAEENRPMDAVGSMLGAGSDINTMMRSGTGAQGNCMRASALTMGAREMMRQFGTNCDSEVNSCKESCTAEAYDNYIDRCLVQKGTSVALLEAAPNTDPAAEAFRRRDEAIRRNYDAGVQVCTRELPRTQSDVSNLMSGMGNSLQAAMQCACQTSNAPGANCQAVPNINNCDTNPSLAGCSVYGPLGACVPGAIGYDAKTCNCLQNPASAGCSGAGSTTPASLFGGNLRAGPAAGGSFAGGGPAGAAGARAGGLDLGRGSGDAVQADLSGASGTGVAKPGAGGAYGGSVGAGGAGNGNIGDEAAAAGAPPEGGISGLFNQAKNAMMNAFGRGGNRKAATPGRNASAANMKKFKPLRGLANSEGMGTRNMDIWKMVNMCANGETCASNRNNYMMAP